nr:MAG TPA: hypothetical protein [Bacteriophage sp.]
MSANIKQNAVIITGTAGVKIAVKLDINPINA